MWCSIGRPLRRSSSCSDLGSPPPGCDASAPRSWHCRGSAPRILSGSIRIEYIKTVSDKRFDSSVSGRLRYLVFSFSSVIMCNHDTILFSSSFSRSYAHECRQSVCMAMGFEIVNVHRFAAIAHDLVISLCQVHKCSASRSPMDDDPF